MTISDLAIKKIKGNNKAINALGYSFDKGYKTIENWLSNKDIRLTTPNAVRIIAKETNLTESQILVDEKPDTQISKSFPIKAKEKSHAKRATA